VIDSNILGKLCHPTNKQNKSIVEWLERSLREGDNDFFLPEIADFELRRKILKMAARDPSWNRPLKRLDGLATVLEYLPLTTTTMKYAAQLWAKAQADGHVTAPPQALDGDVILAAQAEAVSAAVWTTNERHLAYFRPVVSTETLMASEADK
jgi:predicted nucleic acid-binding protein